MKASVYIETTVVSYLVAEPSKDLIQAAHQQITRAWWATRDRFDLYISAAVAAARRLEVLNRISLLAAGPRAGGVVRSLLQSGALPAKARLDAAHVAIAAVNGVDYLVTWNLRHLANAAIRVTTRRDPIVEEVRQHREAIAREHGGRLDAILATLRREEATWPAGTVSRPPKPVVKPASRAKTTATRRPNKRLHRTAARQER